MLRADAAALQCSDASLPLGFLPGAAYEVFRWVIFYVDAVASIAVVGNLTLSIMLHRTTQYSFPLVQGVPQMCLALSPLQSITKTYRTLIPSSLFPQNRGRCLEISLTFPTVVLCLVKRNSWAVVLVSHV